MVRITQQAYFDVRVIHPNALLTVAFNFIHTTNVVSEKGIVSMTEGLEKLNMALSLPFFAALQVEWESVQKWPTRLCIHHLAFPFLN